MSRDRQTKGKDRALVDLARHRNRPAVSFRDFIDDGQPESGATGIFRPCPIGPIKPLEEMRKMFRLDPMPRILDNHSDPFPDRLQANGHGSTGRRVAKGVVEQIDQRLFEPLGIAEDGWNRLGFKRQCDSAIIGKNGQFIHEFVDQRLQGERHEVNGRLVARELRERQQGTRQRDESSHLLKIVDERFAIFLRGPGFAGA